MIRKTDVSWSKIVGSVLDSMRSQEVAMGGRDLPERANEHKLH